MLPVAVGVVVCRVYRKSVNGGRPKELYECTFDIVWNNRYTHAGVGGRSRSSSQLSLLASSKQTKDSRQKAREKAALLEAETIKICDEMLREFGSVLHHSAHTHHIRINHLDVFDALLDAILKPYGQQNATAAAIAAAAAVAEAAAAVNGNTTGAAAGSGGVGGATPGLTAALNAPSTAVASSLFAPSVAGGGATAGTGGLASDLTMTGAAKADGTKSLTAGGAASLAAAISAANTLIPPSTFFMQPTSGGRSALDSKLESPAAAYARALNELRKVIISLSQQRVVGNIPWLKTPMRRILIKEQKMPVRSVDYLGAALTIVGEPGATDTVIRKVTQALGTLHGTGHSANQPYITGVEDSDARLMDAFDSMRLTFAALDTFGLSSRVIWDTGLVGNYDLYAGGMVFQAYSNHTHVSAASANRTGGGVSHASPGVSATGKTAVGTMDVVAVGGRYDSLIGRFVPPNSTQTPVSAVGMNVAIEKIIAHTIALYNENNRNSENRNLNRRLRARELIRWGAHISNDAFRSGSVLLFSTRANMLQERASVANSLWEDGIPAQYIHPKSLTLPHIRQYCMELGIRFLVVFNARTVKTTNFVTIKDLHAGSSGHNDHLADVSTSGGSAAAKAMKRSGGGGDASGDDTQSVFQINMKDIRAFIRGRFKLYASAAIVPVFAS